MKRQLDLDGRAGLGPVAANRNRPVVQLDQMTSDRQIQTETAVATQLCGIGLTKALEDMRRELRVDPLCPARFGHGSGARVLERDAGLEVPARPPFAGGARAEMLYPALK